MAHQLADCTGNAENRYFRVGKKIKFMKKFIVSCLAFFLVTLSKASNIPDNYNLPDSLYNKVESAKINDPILSSQVQSYFENLHIDFSVLSQLMELSSISSDSIDFVNLSRVSLRGESGEAIVAPFKSNSNDRDINFAFAVYLDNGNIYKSAMIKTTYDKKIEHFDMEEGLVFEMINTNGYIATK